METSQQPGGSFLKAFVPGLVVGLIVGGLVSAFVLPIITDRTSKIDPADAKRAAEVVEHAKQEAAKLPQGDQANPDQANPDATNPEPANPDGTPPADDRTQPTPGSGAAPQSEAGKAGTP